MCNHGVQRDDIVFHSGMPLYHSAAGMLGAGCMVTTGVTLVLTRKFSASTFQDVYVCVVSPPLTTFFFWNHHHHKHKQVHNSELP